MYLSLANSTIQRLQSLTFTSHDTLYGKFLQYGAREKDPEGVKIQFFRQIVLTCGSFNKIPAVCMSSHPNILKSSSISRDKPSS